MPNDVKHGGNLRALSQQAGCRPEDILDLSVNLNPLGPPLGAFECFFKSYEKLTAYPEPRAESLLELLAAIHGRPLSQLAAANGSNELLHLTPLALKPPRAVIVAPAYGEYAQACRAARVPIHYFMLSKETDFRLDVRALEQHLKPGDLALLGTPHNPSGSLADPAELTTLIKARPDVTFLVDEAFMDFCGEEHSALSAGLDNALFSRSLTKFYALAGLRMGFMCGPAHLLDKIKELQGIWTMSAPALEMAKFLLSLPPDYARQSREQTAALRMSLAAGLAAFAQLKLFPSSANYILAQSRRPDLARVLLCNHRIALRDCRDYVGLDERFVRIAVCPLDQQERLLAALAELEPGPNKTARPRPRRATALMLQGTGSHAGKSVLTAAFCRIFQQDGLPVAPFKAQNMALNSFVTHDNLEMGRAQAFQAQACRLDPDVRMNPLLLKPNCDTASQVILKGKVRGNFSGRDFYEHRHLFWQTIKDSYDSLAAQYQVLVLEGAGSPGEVNLKQADLVNMNMAAYAGAKVLLAGDIDRGGVYAAFAGTYATLTLAERRLLCGFLVNKFRGDPSLLAPAHDYVQNLTGKPVLGVLDFLPDLRLPEEDSISHGLNYEPAKQEPCLDVALLILPHISNFTDYDPLLLEPDVRLRKVRALQDLGRPDVIILPGTKNTMDDMAFLQDSGLAAAVQELYGQGVWLIGLGGGLQMLGCAIRDPQGLESARRQISGLGLLPLHTVLAPERTLRQSRARRLKDGALLQGYEIRHGQTSYNGHGLDLQLRLDDQALLGYEGPRIFSTYLHGVFNDDHFRRSFLNELKRSLNWPPLAGLTAVYETEESLDRLADHVRQRVDIHNLYRLLGI